MKKLVLLLFFCLSYVGWSQTILMQDGTFNTCIGNFTDSGGTAGAYSNNEDFTITLCSDIPGLGIELDFTAFNLAVGDFMEIYDGPSTASPLIGTFTGAASPGFVETTDVSGCLTIRFVSDAVIFGAGWNANISCCQLVTANWDGSTPADVGGVIVADPLDVITFNGSGTFGVDGTGATYNWDFGDGATDTGTTVNHAYAANGIYDVTLTVTDASGCSSSNDINIQCIIGNGDLEAMMVGDVAFARGSYMEVGLAQNGVFGAPAGLAPPFFHDPRDIGNNLFGYIANPQRDGWVDYDGCYFTPGSPEEGFAIEIDGIAYNNNRASTGSPPPIFDIPGAITSAGIEADPCSGELAVINWSGQIDDIRIDRRVIVTGFGLFIQMETILTNIGATPKNDIFWMHNVDPDNNQSINGSFTTDNEIIAQADALDPIAFVCAFQDPLAASEPDADGSNVCFYASDNRSRVTFGGFANRDPSDIWNGIGFTQTEGATNTADEAISIAFNIGTLNPGESQSFVYWYTFADFTGTGIVTTPSLIRFTGTNPTACGASDGFITITNLVPSTTYDVTYEDDGVPVGPLSLTSDAVGNIVIAGLDAGVYDMFALTNALGCDFMAADVVTLIDPGAPLYAVTPTQPTGCTADGTLAFSGLAASTTYDVTYTVDGVTVGPVSYTTDAAGEFIITGLDQGTYTLINVSLGGCDSFDGGTYILTYPGFAFTVTTTDPATCTPDGTLTIAGLNPSEAYDITYTVDGVVVGPVTYTTDASGNIIITGLPQGTYTDVTVEQGACSIVDPGPYTITYPPITFTVATTDLVLCDSDGALTLSGLDPSTTYFITYTVDGVVVGPVAYTSDASGVIVVGGLDDGTYTDITVESTPCVTVDPGPYVLNDPILTPAVSVTDSTICGPGGTITITGLTAGFSYDIGYTLDGTPIAAVAFTADATGTVVVGGVLAGTVTDVTITLNDCSEVIPGPFVINNPPDPVPVDPEPYVLCDTGVADGFTEFDLTVKIPEITAGDTDLAVSFHLTLADADTGTAPLPTLYTNVTNPQTIYVRVESVTTGCYATTTLDLEVLDAPTAITPTPLEYCDPDNDGFGVFTLEDATLEITGGATDVIVTYHETFADATNGVLPLTSPYNNIVFGTQTVYARVENAVTTGDACFNIVELVLIVLDTPQIVDPEPLLACDDNDDGIVVFDLTVKDPEILDGLDPADYTVEYYEDAAFTSLIAPATAYTNLTNPQTVFVLVTDNTNLCTATTTLELIVNFPPEVFPPAPLELCDVNNPGDEVEEFDLELATPEITGGDTSLIVTYHETAADADTGDNPLTSPYTNTSNPQTIYVRVEDPDTGCFVSDVVTLDLRVNPQPSPTPDPTPIEICDADNDGFVDSFILTDRDVEIINGEPDVVVSYHETLADAQADLFPLSSPYANIVAYSQIVYARVENTLTGCFTIVELELIVLNSPELPLEIEDYVICDDDDDGIAVFDLTTKDPEIYGSQDPATLDLTYHLSEADALAGVMPIVTPAAFVNTTNPQTIWVRLFDPVTGCASVGSFELIVSLPPVIAAPGDLDALERCDDETADGFASFDLTLAEDDITLGAPGLLVQYYTTEMDAQDDTNVIDPATDYTNTVNPQTIWVRVTDGDTGCVSFTTLTIRVLPNPSPNTDPDPIEVCDEVTVGDGIEVIDLTQREAEIIGGEPGVSATYYETEADATLGDPLLAIADPTAYSNIETPQIIWVRITNDTTGCFTLVELPIIVHPLPEAPEVSDYIICEVATDGVATFDLNTKLPEILGGQDPTDLEITFHEVEADADAGINAIATPEAFVNVTNPQTIYVRITNTVTGCYSATQSFNIEVREGATATAPAAVYRICDNVGDGTDGIGEFTLSTQDAEILGGQDPVIYVVSYHASDADATTGDNALPDSYINTENPQVIWARVTNTDTGCFAITTLTLEVSPLPVITLEDSYRLCVDEFGNPIQNESGEASPPILNTGLSDLDYTFEWFLNGNPLPETTSSIVARAGGTYTVIATETTSGLGCSAEASTTVTVSSPPTTFSAEVITNAFADDHQIQAEASGLGVYFFQLDDGPLQESGLFTNVSPGDHIVTIVDQNGCGSVSIPVGVIDYPLFFTPNQDGYHDTWNIIGIASNPTAKIYIFDRFGKLLKQLSPLGPGWDGTYNGNPMPSSDYWFQVIYDEDEVEKEFRGHFTLKR
ncbi:T9SS type B sorting domain-containing protein [Gilvibacter sp.]|uniref:T9SS type B sorting domain-containing protein n=1 Tax=Gilvibacter sp. TaxID=2729997 RepID=UPI003B52BE9F